MHISAYGNSDFWYKNKSHLLMNTQSSAWEKLCWQTFRCVSYDLILGSVGINLSLYGGFFIVMSSLYHRMIQLSVLSQVNLNGSETSLIKFEDKNTMSIITNYKKSIL